MAKARLVTRADDLGSFTAANKAIDDAVANGICRNAGVMPTCEAFDEAVAMFKGRDDVCLGLHSTLNSEWDEFRWGPVLPASEVPCICEPDGTLKRTVQAIHEGGAVFSQMLAELRAQLGKCREAGLKIEYLDTHMSHGWVEEEPGSGRRFIDHLRQWAEDEGLVFFDRDYGAGDPHLIIKGRVVKGLGVGEDEGDFIDAVCEALRRAAEAGGDYVLVTHPAMPDEQMRRVYHPPQKPGDVAAERENDWKAFADERVVKACREFGVEPIKVVDL